LARQLRLPVRLTLQNDDLPRINIENRLCHGSILNRCVGLCDTLESKSEARMHDRCSSRSTSILAVEEIW
jgi:hypothetical protein